MRTLLFTQIFCNCRNIPKRKSLLMKKRMCCVKSVEQEEQERITVTCCLPGEYVHPTVTSVASEGYSAYPGSSSSTLLTFQDRQMCVVVFPGHWTKSSISDLSPSRGQKHP